MVEYGVTAGGFVNKPYIEIAADIEARLKRAFGSDVDLTPGSPIKVLSDLFVLELSKLWIELEQTYKSGFINLSNDEALDEVGHLMGILRLDGIPATGEITFNRTEVLPVGPPRIIPAGARLATSDAFPNYYVTTQTGYFAYEITDEEYPAQLSTFTVFDTINNIGDLISVTGSDLNDYGSGATYSNRTITLAGSVPIGISLTIDYKPISITLNIQSEINSESANAATGTVNVLVDDISFIHAVTNEEDIDDGSDTETDSLFRRRIVAAAGAIGNATSISLEYGLRNITGVTNVIVQDVYTVNDEDIIAGYTSDTTVTVTNTPLSSVVSVTGATDGALTVVSFEDNTGEITFTPALTGDQNVTVDYYYEDPTQLLTGSLGKIKIYVSGGVVGDESTEDTIVYEIERTRAAGIQSIGYNTDSTYAEGVSSAPFSWFYRIGEAVIDVTITLVFDSESSLDSAAKDAIEADVQSDIEEFVNDLGLTDKIWKNKLLQLAISKHDDIDTATVNLFELNDATQPGHPEYLEGTSAELPVAGTIIITR